MESRIADLLSFCSLIDFGAVNLCREEKAFGGLLVLIDTGSIIDMLKAMGILAFVKLLDSTAISPLTVGKSVNVHPLMVIIVISVGGLLHGVWGMLLSVPLHCSMRVSLQILYRGFVEYGNW